MKNIFLILLLVIIVTAIGCVENRTTQQSSLPQSSYFLGKEKKPLVQLSDTMWLLEGGNYSISESEITEAILLLKNSHHVSLVSVERHYLSVNGPFGGTWLDAATITVKPD